MATSSTLGHKIVWQDNKWVYLDTQMPINISDRPCKKCNRKTIKVGVFIPADLSHSGESYWGVKQIDACIAPIVAALSNAGIHMRGSCCGHGKCDGRIELQDGRTLIVKETL